MKKILAILLTVLPLVLLAGCGSSQKTLSGTDQDAVLAFSETKTDNLLAGMNAGDYVMFSQDFDKDMLNAMPQSEFEKLKAERDSKLGKYLSRQVDSVVQTGDFYVVIYDAAFEKENSVVVRVVFRITEPHEVSGLWFNK